MTDIISQTASVLNAKHLNEAKGVDFDTLIKDRDLLKTVKLAIGKNKLGSRDDRIELEGRPSVDLADYITAVIAINRPDSKFVEYGIHRGNLVHGDNVIVRAALSHKYTLNELINFADTYAYRNNKFEATAEKTEDGSANLIRLTYSSNGFQSYAFDFYPSEVSAIIEALQNHV